MQIYTTPACASCIRAKRLLAKRGIDVTEIDVSLDRMAMIERTGRKTVPQIVLNGTAIGGYEDLVALDRSGGLAALVSE